MTLRRNCLSLELVNLVIIIACLLLVLTIISFFFSVLLVFVCAVIMGFMPEMINDDIHTY